MSTFAAGRTWLLTSQRSLKYGMKGDTPNFEENFSDVEMEGFALVLFAVLVLRFMRQQLGLGIWLVHGVLLPRAVPAALPVVEEDAHTESELVVYRRPTLDCISQDSAVIKQSIQCTDRDQKSKFVVMGIKYRDKRSDTKSVVDSVGIKLVKKGLACETRVKHGTQCCADRSNERSVFAI